MATKTKGGAPQPPQGKPAKQGEKGGKGGKCGKKGDAGAPKRGAHAGAGLPAPVPRLKDYYCETVGPKLSQQSELNNRRQIPNPEKIVVNVGVGEAIKQPKLLDAAVEELGLITDERPTRKRAKKSIANFGLREGQEIGAAVTLRGA